MEKSFCRLVEQWRKEIPERIAFQWYSDTEKELKKRTYAEYVHDICRAAAVLQETETNIKGKHIALAGQNSYDFAVCAMAVLCAGGILVLLNTRESVEILCEQMTLADVQTVLADEMCAEKIAPFCKSEGIPVYGITDFRNIHREAELQEARSPEDTALLVFTSGTSGRQKCVMLSQDNFMAALDYFNDDMKQYVVKGIDKRPLSALHMLPMYHIIGIVGLLCVLADGDMWNLCCDMRYLSRDNALMQSDYTVVVPAILQMWGKAIVNGRPQILGSLKGIITGGAAINPELVDVFIKNGTNLIQSYGMTETFGFGLYHSVNESHNYSATGKPGLNTEAKIDDGEVCISGPLVMMGYYKDPEMTAEAIRDGWLHTGDLGYIDAEGYVYLTGRKKNLIILANGENVSPEELEGLLQKNEAVREVLVKEKDNKICADIFCDPAAQEEVRAFVTEVNRALPLYKRMTLVEFRAEPFERTSSGKIKRN